ncbi:hypothetical protein [Fibrella aquatica]|uniref:hypothetical protein n=1 Tax=Fibrella aquatica TaxID=3242487 RepID=UPI003522D642
MASASNLTTDSIDRLRNDETGEVLFLFTRDGLSLNIAAMRFSIGFCRKDSIEELERFDIGLATEAVVPGAELTRPEGTTDRLKLDLSPQTRMSLSAETYTVYLYEITGESKRDPQGYFTWKWLSKPASFVPNRPREPGAIQIDYVSSTGLTSLSTVYVLSGLTLIERPTYQALLTVALPSGTCLVEVANDERWNDTDTLYLCKTRNGITTRRKILLAD